MSPETRRTHFELSSGDHAPLLCDGVMLLYSDVFCCLRGSILHKLGEHTEALSNMKEAVQHDSSNKQYFNLMGLVRNALGDCLGLRCAIMGLPSWKHLLAWGSRVSVKSPTRAISSGSLLELRGGGGISAGENFGGGSSFFRLVPKSPSRNFLRNPGRPGWAADILLL